MDTKTFLRDGSARICVVSAAVLVVAQYGLLFLHHADPVVVFCCLIGSTVMCLAFTIGAVTHAGTSGKYLWVFLLFACSLFPLAADLSGLSEFSHVLPRLAPASQANSSITQQKPLDTSLVVVPTKPNPNPILEQITRGIKLLSERRVDDGRRELNQALAELNTALGAGGCSECVLLNRGWVYLWLGQGERARQDFEQVIAINPVNALAYGNLCNYYWAFKHDKKKALYYLEEELKRGYRDWKLLYDENEDGHFLHGLNQAPDFKALLRRYGAPASKYR